MSLQLYKKLSCDRRKIWTDLIWEKMYIIFEESVDHNVFYFASKSLSWIVNSQNSEKKIHKIRVVLQSWGS